MVDPLLDRYPGKFPYTGYSSNKTLSRTENKENRDRKKEKAHLPSWHVGKKILSIHWNFRQKILLRNFCEDELKYTDIHHLSLDNKEKLAEIFADRLPSQTRNEIP